MKPSPTEPILGPNQELKLARVWGNIRLKPSLYLIVESPIKCSNRLSSLGLSIGLRIVVL